MSLLKLKNSFLAGWGNWRFEAQNRFEHHCLLAWRWKKPFCTTFRLPLEAGRNSSLINSKETGTLVLQPPWAESYWQQEWTYCWLNGFPGQVYGG